MKKADNFDSSKWLVENKITTQSRLNEDLVAKITALPNHHTAENTEDAILVVGKYAVVRYDESDEGGENMYVVWDNTVNQDEIGSYDDEPEFESTEPAEVAAFLKKNESLNEEDALTHNPVFSIEKQMVFKNITQIMDQELNSGKPTSDALVKLRNFINNILKSDF